MIWQYGITTVPARRLTTLPVTLRSLADAGFDQPRLFVDGESEAEYCDDPTGGLPITARVVPVGAFANWLLAIWELYLRDPTAERFALFEDDILVARNLREYLERCEVPAAGYMNCCTSDIHCGVLSDTLGWHIVDRTGMAWQGKGAQALVFDAAGIRAMLGQPHWAAHPHRGRNGRRNQDGAVWRAMVGAGRREYVHNPSLVDHLNPGTTLSTPGIGIQTTSFNPSFNPLDLVQHGQGAVSHPRSEPALQSRMASQAVSIV